MRHSSGQEQLACRIRSTTVDTLTCASVFWPRDFMPWVRLQELRSVWRLYVIQRCFSSARALGRRCGSFW